MRSTPIITANNRSSRRGTALLIVLVTITLLTLGAYTFSNTMLSRYRLSVARSSVLQSQYLAQSGVQYAASLLTQDGGGWTQDLYNNPQLFHVPLSENSGFTIVAPLEDPPIDGSSVLRTGMSDECGKININYLATMTDLVAARNVLMVLPNMTEGLADGMLDWIDADLEAREFGAEFDSYTTVTPRDGPIDALEELLLVGDMSPWLLYGEDANRNGVLDPNENDDLASLPYDDGDGLLTFGWSEFLTVRSSESNLQRIPQAIENYGTPKINVNNATMATLWDTLELALGEEAATFIVAYRIYGPVVPEGEVPLEPTVTESPLNGAAQETGTGDTETDQALSDVAGGLANALSGGATGTVSRGGLDLSQAATTQIKSLFDLVGVDVLAQIDGVETTLSSPWSANLGDMQQYLPAMMDALSTNDKTVIAGRINVLQARIEVLRAIPNIPAELPDSIVVARAGRLAAGTASQDQLNSAGWMLVDGIVDLPTMRMLDPWLTGRGDVYRLQSVGHSDVNGQMCRYEALIDASGATPKIIFQRELRQRELGDGYQLQQLPRFTQ